MRAVLEKLVVASLCAVCGAAAVAQPAFERLSDEDLASLLASIRVDLLRFGGALDPGTREVDLPSGTVRVDDYLAGLEQALEALRERFTGKDAASAEVATLLQRAVPMNSYVRAHSAANGATEWNRLGADLNRLARAYGTSFPPPTEAKLARIGDVEVGKWLDALSGVSRSVGQPLSKATQSDPRLAAAGRNGIQSLGGMEDMAKALKSRLDHGEPATAEARRLQALARKLEGVLDTDGVPPAVKALWEGPKSNVDKVAKAFGLAAPAALEPAAATAAR